MLCKKEKSFQVRPGQRWSDPTFCLLICKISDLDSQIPSPFRSAPVGWSQDMSFQVKYCRFFCSILVHCSQSDLVRSSHAESDFVITHVHFVHLKIRYIVPSIRQNILSKVKKSIPKSLKHTEQNASPMKMYHYEWSESHPCAYVMSCANTTAPQQAASWVCAGKVVKLDTNERWKLTNSMICSMDALEVSMNSGALTMVAMISVPRSTLFWGRRRITHHPCTSILVWCNGHYNRTPDLGKCMMWWNVWDLAR